MLTNKQVQEIKEHLEKAQNPLFLFDNDQDGLCSYLLLQRYLGRGKGIPVKSFPGLNVDYFRRIKELDADYVFILDKPVVEKDFWDEVEKINIPIVWIDHHEIDKKLIPDFVNYYNPLFNKKPTNEPVTYLCSQVNDKKEDLWLGVVGCISDRFLPDFYEDFKKQYPELSIDSLNPFEIFYKSEIGKVARIFGFGLKDRITNVIRMQKFLMKAKSPSEVLNEVPKNKTMHERYEQINKKYVKFLEKARIVSQENEKLLYFKYGGDMSISADLANQLSYEFSDRLVVVIYVNGVKANISARGKEAKNIILKAIEGIEGARGGGHEEAVGAQVPVDNLEKFKERLFNFVE